MSHVFPYGITLQEGGKVVLFPAAEVVFPTKDGERISLFLIIDSGATVSALPKSDAEILGIDVARGTPTVVGGISGALLQGWRHEIVVRLGNEEINLPITFLDSDTVPRVLGREGVFERFTIVFEEGKRRSGFINQESNEAQLIETILEGLET